MTRPSGREFTPGFNHIVEDDVPAVCKREVIVGFRKAGVKRNGLFNLFPGIVIPPLPEIHHAKVVVDLGDAYFGPDDLHVLVDRVIQSPCFCVQQPEIGPGVIESVVERERLPICRHGVFGPVHVGIHAAQVVIGLGEFRVGVYRFFIGIDRRRVAILPGVYITDIQMSVRKPRVFLQRLFEGLHRLEVCTLLVIGHAHHVDIGQRPARSASLPGDGGRRSAHSLEHGAIGRDAARLRPVHGAHGTPFQGAFQLPVHRGIILKEFEGLFVPSRRGVD